MRTVSKAGSTQPFEEIANEKNRPSLPSSPDPSYVHADAVSLSFAAPFLPPQISAERLGKLKAEIESGTYQASAASIASKLTESAVIT